MITGHMRSIGLGATLAVAFTGHFTDVQAAPKLIDCAGLHYRIVEIPLKPRAINSRGVLAGTTKAQHAATWDERTGIHELPLPAGFDSAEAVGINDSGHVVGVAYSSDRNLHAAFYFADGAVSLLPGVNTRAYGISASNVIVGEAVLPGTTTSSGVYWKRNVLHSISMCCGGIARDVSAGGTIVGNTYDQEGVYHGFIWRAPGSLRLMGDLDHFSSAIATNDHDHVVLQTFTRIYISRDATLAPVEINANYPVHPNALNNADNIVGAMGRSTESEKAFVWSASTGSRDLNKLIDSPSGFRVKQATAINSSCNIVGTGEVRHIERSGFYLAPL